MKKFSVMITLLFVITNAWSQSKKLIDSLEQVASIHSNDTIGVLAIDNIVSEFMRTSPAQAIHHAHRQITKAKEIDYHNGISLGYATMVTMHQETGNLDSGLYYLSAYESLYKKTGSRRVGINYSNTAGLFYKNQGQYKNALPFLLEALKLIGPNGRKVNQAGQLLNIGNTYYQMGDLVKAPSYHLKALRLFEEIDNKRGQSFCLQSLGNDYLGLQQYKTAEQYYFLSEKMKTSLNDKRGQLTSWMSLGDMYQQVNNIEGSMKYSKMALERARELKLTSEEMRVLFNIGKLHQQQKQNTEAKDIFRKMLSMAQNAGDSLLVSRTRAELVMIDNDVRKERREEETLMENIRISLEKGDRSNTADGHHKLAEWYAVHKQFEKAFDNLKRAEALGDSIRGSDVLIQLKRLEEEYKGEKKEKEIALLKKDQTINALAISKQKAMITAIVIALIGVIVIAVLLVNRYRVLTEAKRLIEIERVRNGIARDLHDDIGSTLSSINILSRVALVEDGNTKNYLQRIGDQSAQMMENISDIVWSINPHNDSMTQAIMRMREFAGEILESKNISWNLSEKLQEGLTLDADKRKNLFLIFKESINNAAKYSKASKVEINLIQDQNTLLMRVKDDGIGFEENTINPGNGLRNMRERAKEVKGTVFLTSIIGQGTEVELRLPLA